MGSRPGGGGRWWQRTARSDARPSGPSRHPDGSQRRHARIAAARSRWAARSDSRRAVMRRTAHSAHAVGWSVVSSPLQATPYGTFGRGFERACTPVHRSDRVSLRDWVFLCCTHGGAPQVHGSRAGSGGIEVHPYPCTSAAVEVHGNRAPHDAPQVHGNRAPRRRSQVGPPLRFERNRLLKDDQFLVGEFPATCGHHVGAALAH